MLNLTCKRYIQKQLVQKAKQINSKIQYDITYNQKTIMPYNAQDFFQVVYEVENYHYFLPWCSRSVIHKRYFYQIKSQLQIFINLFNNRKGFSYFEAELFINFKVYQDSYISKVSSDVASNNYRIISLSNNISAFKSLKSTWNIKPLTDKTCQIDYDIDFEFKNYLYQTVAQMFLDNVIKKINSSFEIRLQELARQDYFKSNRLSVFDNLNKSEGNKQQQNSEKKSEKQQQTIVSNNMKNNDFITPDRNSISQESSIKQSVNENSTVFNQIFNQIHPNNQNILEQQQKQIEIDLQQQIEEHINQLVQQNIANQEEASVFMKSLLKSPEQKELIVNAYKFFILNKGLINMNEEQANWKFLNVLRSATLYR